MSWNDCAAKNWEDCKFTDWEDCIWDMHSLTYYSGQKYNAARAKMEETTVIVKRIDPGKKPYMEIDYNEMMRENPDKFYRG